MPAGLAGYTEPLETRSRATSGHSESTSHSPGQAQWLPGECHDPHAPIQRSPGSPRYFRALIMRLTTECTSIHHPPPTPMTTTTLTTAWDTDESPARPVPAISRPRRGHWKNAATQCAIGAGLASSLLAGLTGSSWPTILIQGTVAFTFALLVLLPCACFFAQTQERD